MWNPYLGIHVFSFARFVFTAALLVWSVSSGQADSGPTDLWSLYLREHAAGLCGRALTEEQETELDEAQHLARVRSQLTLSEAAVLYRRARVVAVSARDALCSRETTGRLKSRLRNSCRLDPSALADGALWYPK